MSKLVRFVLIAAVVLVVGYAATAVFLTFRPDPTFDVGPFPAERPAAAAAFDPQAFTTRDGTDLFARRFTADSTDTILLLHGVTGDSAAFNTGAARLRDISGANVVALDLRGHGQSGGPSGDVAYIGQYEDDVADVIAALRAENPHGRVILAGHSMGGGIALRFARLADTPPVDGYLLFAPHLGTDAPTMPQPDPETADFVAAYTQLHIPRLIGLSMLNAVGITAFNDQPTMFYNLTDSVTHTYSYRAMVNTSPTDYAAALEAVDQPLLVLVGEADEAFVASAYPDAIAQHTAGDVHLIAGETHNGIVENAAALDLAGQWLTSLHGLTDGS